MQESSAERKLVTDAVQIAIAVDSGGRTADYKLSFSMPGTDSFKTSLKGEALHGKI